MERRSVAPAWLRWLLVFVALGFVTIGLAIEAVRIADIAGCAQRAQAEPLVCPVAPGAYEIALTLTVEVVVVIVAGWEVVGSRRWPSQVGRADRPSEGLVGRQPAGSTPADTARPVRSVPSGSRPSQR